MKKEEIIKYVKEHATSTILSFPDRGSSWGSSSYRGNFSGWIPASIIVRYGCKSVSEIYFSHMNYSTSTPLDSNILLLQKANKVGLLKISSA